MPIDIAQLNEIIGKIRKEEKEKIKELYSEYIAETMDDDELENEAGGKNMNKETNDNNNSTYLQSTKAYRTKACLLGVLLAFTFVIREFFIYNIQLGFAEYNGVDRHSFIDWLAVYRNYDGMFFLGLLISSYRMNG